MKKIISTPIILFFWCFVFTNVANAQPVDSLISELSKKWEHAKVYTLKMADAMPAENYNFKPTPDVMSFKQQLVHIAENIKWLSSAYLFSPGSKPEKDTALWDKAAVVKYIADAYEQGLAAHQLLRQQQLNEVVPFFAGPMSRRKILVLMHDHQTHHVGQLILYLRLKGMKPPDYVGW